MKLISYLIICILFSPAPAFAVLESGKCSLDGYTITTINGVLTNDKGASDNMIALRKKVGIIWNDQVVDYQFLLNPTHLGGISDIFNSITQKAFENEVVADYDLIEMLKDASQKVKTQKLLLVAHSQGNFYANSFYDVVTQKQVGGVPAQSIGVYGVANPASRVAGGGKWLTSDTDKVITWVVGNIPLRKIKTPNAHIVLQPGDGFIGHDFALVYIPHEGNQIIEDINASLDNLSKNAIQDENAPCMSPPEITLAHKQQGAIYAVTDPVLNPLGAGTLWTLGKGVKGTVLVYNTTEAFAKWGSHMEAVAIVWTYDTTVTVGKFVGKAAVVGASTVYDTVAGVLTNKPVAGNNNTASVILAIQPAQNMISANKHVTTVTNLVAQPTTAQVTTSQKPQTVFVFEPKVQNGTNVPKLVFVGSFVGSGTTVSQVLGSQAAVSGSEEIVVVEEVIDNAGAGIPAPALSAPQCAQTLATDGCLLATTTVHFEWPAVAGVDHYLVSKNGTYATTTDTAVDVEIKDFSDYIFEVVAVDADGNPSATSTQEVSVATIPIAINEIAWMGTVASPNDEWFEIKNNTSHTIDLSQWKLNAKDGAPYVELAGNIEPHAYTVFERKINTVRIPASVAYATSTGLLSNTGDQLSLFYTATSTSVSKMFDQTPEREWVAGATSTRQTMERFSSRESGIDPTNWGTNLGYIKNGEDAEDNLIEGTPGEQNSVSTLINKGQDITSDFTLTADEERYVVPNSVWVDASSTLTIEPGVVIQFYNIGKWPPPELNILGTLHATGTPQNPVVFESLSDNNEGHIYFVGSEERKRIKTFATLEEELSN